MVEKCKNNRFRSSGYGNTKTYLNVSISSKSASYKYKGILGKYRKHKETCRTSESRKQWFLYSRVFDDVLRDQRIGESVSKIEIGGRTVYYVTPQEDIINGSLNILILKACLMISQLWGEKRESVRD